MIEDPPPLIFAPAAERPPAEIVERFRGVPTSFIVDAMGGTGALDWRIKSLVGNSLVGVALTCDCGPLDNLAFMAALADCRPRGVLVAATGGHGARSPADRGRAQSRRRGLRHRRSRARPRRPRNDRPADLCDGRHSEFA